MAYGSNITKALYDLSPSLFKNVAASIYGLKERKERYGNDYFRSLAFLQESQFWTNERLMEFQKEQLRSFIPHAVRSVPYYRVRPDYAGKERLAELPLLAKQDVRMHSKELCSESIPQLSVRYAQTSGTSGTPLRFPLSRFCFQREYAFCALHYLWGGVSLEGRDKIAICAGHPVAFHSRKIPPFWVYDKASNWLFMSSYHLSGRNLASYIEELEQFQPVMIGGYPSSIYLLAVAYEQFRRRPLRLRSIFTSSETLLGYQRETIERAFETKVFNWYGTSEMSANIVECEMGEMHLKLEHSAVEILSDDDKPVKAGERGRLVCTAFGNAAFPLIRYDIGDVVKLSTTRVSQCGRGGLLVDEVIGRREDYIVTPDGRLVGRLDHLFKEMKNVVEAQIRQDTIDEIVIRVVKTREFSLSHERHLLQEAATRLGTSIRISLDYVDRIERGKNGKFQFVLTSLNQKDMIKSILHL